MMLSVFLPLGEQPGIDVVVNGQPEAQVVRQAPGQGSRILGLDVVVRVVEDLAVLDPDLADEIGLEAHPHEKRREADRELVHPGQGALEELRLVHHPPQGVDGVGVGDDGPGLELGAVRRPDAVSGVVAGQDLVDLGVQLDLAAVLLDEADERVADLLRGPDGIEAAALEITHQRHGVVEGGELGRRQTEVTPQPRDDGLELGIIDPLVEHGPPGPIEVLEEQGELRREAGHVDLPARARETAHVVGEPLHVGEDGVDGRRVVGEALLEDGDIARDVHVRHPDVMVRVDGPVERFVRREDDVLDLREALDQVRDPVPEADRRRVEGNVESEAAGARKGRCISARYAVLFEDQDLEALPGEGRGRAEAAEARADDDRVVRSGRSLVPAGPRAGRCSNPRRPAAPRPAAF